MLCVELGLFALQELAPGEAAKDVWALLTGYDFRSPDRSRSDLPGSLRWLLEPLKSEHDWRRALTHYLGLPQQLRMFDIVDLDAPAVPREVGGRAFREERYRAELARLPAHRTENPAVAESGKRHRVRRTGASVVIPPGLVATSPPRHRTGRRRRVPRFTWAALERTARVMDGIDAELGLKNDWAGRVGDLRLFVIGPSKPRPSRQLRLQDVLHVVGMPAVGKTTLITVASVLLAAAPRRHNLTLILGDVVAVMNMVRDLERYGVAAAPILGSASRGRHLQQLHRPSDPTVRGLPLLADERMKWVSTACTLQGLLELSRPWALVDAPCERGLEPWSDHDDATEPATPPQPCSCPLVGGCGRHTAARALVKANVWVATAPSLLHCRVPGQLSDQALRYLELAWARSDAFFVDEADRVQIQWDQAFSPSQTLAGPGRDAWLDEVRPMFERHIRDTKGRDLTSSPVRDWSVTISVAALVLARLRHLMAEHAHVREWLSEGYFNEWRLSLRLAVEIARRPGPSGAGGGNWTTDDPCRKQWQHSFGEWMRKPDHDYSGLDDRVAMLCRLSSRLGDSPESVTKALKNWLATLPDVTVGDGQPLERLAVRFHVTILIALLAGKLDLLTRACWEVENETGLESMSTSLVHRPPAEYSPLVPESPMGNLLGFQYREHDTDTTESQLGTLSFFRCSGIGRWLLINLPNLYRDGYPGPGPGVLLLSATSRAGNSPRFDVQVPVSAILTSVKGEKVPLDERIVMHYSPVTVTDPTGTEHAVRVSGRLGQDRTEALNAMLSGLCKARPSLRGPRPSRLEEIRDNLPDGRRRILLLVGSYIESQDVLAALLRTRPEWADHVLRMVPDDDSGTHHWSNTINRGNISTLASHEDVWLLIAPLQAIERGHNILNDQHVAALGATVYLVRPHLHPEDLDYHVQGMHRWAIDQILGGMSAAGPVSASLGDRARMFKRLGNREWLDRLEESLRYSTTERDSAERRAMDWTNIAPLNQVIGRMLRGGATAQIHFCDGAFDPKDNDGPLLGMYRALDEAMHGPDAVVANTLYQPLHHALRTLLEKHRARL